jgi:hypothetical protein
MVEITNTFNQKSEALAQAVAYLDKNGIRYELVNARQASTGRIGKRLHLFIDVAPEQAEEIFRRIYSDGMHDYYAERLETDSTYRRLHRTRRKTGKPQRRFRFREVKS